MKYVLHLCAIAAAFGFASAASANIVKMTCSIQTASGNYLTAVNGGGLTNDVIHSNATTVSTWEKFTLLDQRAGGVEAVYGVRTSNGHFLTMVNGGGLINDAIHSDATSVNAWEKLQFVYLGANLYAIRTENGRYLTAVGGGGRTSDVIHSDATQVSTWEKFKVDCSR